MFPGTMPSIAGASERFAPNTYHPSGNSAELDCSILSNTFDNELEQLYVSLTTRGTHSTPQALALGASHYHSVEQSSAYGSTDANHCFAPYDYGSIGCASRNAYLPTNQELELNHISSTGNFGQGIASPLPVRATQQYQHQIVDNSLHYTSHSTSDHQHNLNTPQIQGFDAPPVSPFQQSFYDSSFFNPVQYEYQPSGNTSTLESPGHLGNYFLARSSSRDFVPDQDVASFATVTENRSFEKQSSLSTIEANNKKRVQEFRDVISLPMDFIDGLIVPQAMYRPLFENDQKRYFSDCLLKPAIHFSSFNGKHMGVSLRDATKGARMRHLDHPNDTVLENCGTFVSIRLEWPGYRSWSKQIPTKDYRKPPRPITRGKLARDILKCVERFFQERKLLTVGDTVKHFQISNRVQVSDLVLVSLHHVSKGSWQPHFKVRRSLCLKK